MIRTHCLAKDIAFISLEDLLVAQCEKLAIWLGLDLVGICAVVARAFKRLNKLNSVH